jgi:hypothetical protein
MSRGEVVKFPIILLPAQNFFGSCGTVLDNWEGVRFMSFEFRMSLPLPTLHLILVSLTMAQSPKTPPVYDTQASTPSYRRRNKSDAGSAQFDNIGQQRHRSNRLEPN